MLLKIRLAFYSIYMYILLLTQIFRMLSYYLWIVSIHKHVFIFYLFILNINRWESINLSGITTKYHVLCQEYNKYYSFKVDIVLRFVSRGITVIISSSQPGTIRSYYVLFFLSKVLHTNKKALQLTGGSKR